MIPNLHAILLEHIFNLNKKSMIIAIDGRCAAGKTTLSKKIEEISHCNVIHMDHFFLQPYQHTSKRLQEPGGNIDYERFLEEVMIPLSQGKTVTYRPYDCHRKKLAPSIQIKSNPITIIEGSYSCHPTLWNFYDLRIFLDISPDEQLRRIEHRNGSKTLALFRNRWIPLEEKYFAYYHIQERCDYTYKFK